MRIEQLNTIPVRIGHHQFGKKRFALRVDYDGSGQYSIMPPNEPSRIVADTFETNHHVYGFDGSSRGLEKARSDWLIDILPVIRLWTEV